MRLTLKVKGLERASDASDILSAVNDKIDTLFKDRMLPPPLVEFHFDDEKPEGPVFRGEESTFSRYMTSTSVEGETATDPRKRVTCPY